MKGLFLTSVLALAFLGLVAFAVNRPVGGAESVIFVVNKGDGSQTIAAGLAESKLIKSRKFFLFTTWSRGSRGDFKAGSFELSPSMTTREIERSLTSTTPISEERTVKILEGWTLRDIAEYLENEGIASKKEFYAEVGEPLRYHSPGSLPDWKASFKILGDKPNRSNFEGYLFPDTYRIFAGGDVKSLLRRMFTNFDKKLTPELRTEISASGRSVFEIIIMASVIEKEVFGEADRAMVSDVFWKRVEAGMGLQADSTVNYVTGGSKPAVSYDETQLDSPWNTYKNKGLPAGPISNPGISAIIAAIRPRPNPYWFFLTDKNGGVHYGRDLDEHNANKARYLR